MNKRYLYLKQRYSKTLILFYKKRFLADQKFLDFYGINTITELKKLRINYIAFNDEMKILDKCFFKDDQYDLYYQRYLLFLCVSEIYNCLKKKTMG